MSAPGEFSRIDVELSVTDGTVLRGWHYRPDITGLHPVVVMSHGFGVVKEMALPAFAEAFAAAGMAVLVYDHRNLGASDGEPRQEIDPWAQLSDARDVITHAAGLEGVDPHRIGVWGTSYSGGHVLVLAATDARIKAVVSQVPTISGSVNASRRATAQTLAAMQTAFAVDRSARLTGDAPALVPNAPEVTAEDLVHAGDDIEKTPMGNDLRAWLRATTPGDLTGLRNELTLRSHELYATYEPGRWIAQIAPTPLLMVCLDNDTITPTDEVLRGYSEAREPKRLALLPGGHCDAYGIQRSAAASAATEWFLEHL